MHMHSRALKYLFVATTLIAPYANAGSFHIGPGPLEQALLEFSRQSGVQLVFASSLVADMRTQGVATEADAATALAILLRGTRLHAEPINSGAFVLKPARQLPPTTTAAKQHAVDLDEIRTSILLTRTLAETHQPVTVIDRQQIEASGFQTLYDLLRNQPGLRVDNAPIATNDGQTYLNNGLSGATGAASVSLHGLGAGTTPVFIDGRPAVTYGLTKGQFGTTTDLNGIPLTLVERVEILRDGASVLYGGDAMAGALNIVLRQQFKGAEIKASTGMSASHGDAGQQRVSGTFGQTLSGETAHFLFSFDYFHRQPLLNRQRKWSRNDSASGSDDFFFTDGAAFGYAGSLCRVVLPTDDCAPAPDGPASLQSAMTSRSMLMRGDWIIGTAALYGNLRWTSIGQSQQSPPSALADYIYGRDPVSGRDKIYSFEDVGPVRNRTDSRTLQLRLGIKGIANDWQWDASLDGQRNLTSEHVLGVVSPAALESGAYVPGGHNSPSVLAAIAPSLIRRGQASRTGVSGRINGPLAQTRHGDITLAAGLDAFHETLTDHPDPRLLDGDIFQFLLPTSRHESQWSNAAYAEVQVPLAQRLSTNIGLRIEHVGSGPFAALPHLGAKWDIDDWISLRGSWAKGYRAPPSLSLDHPTTTGFLRYMRVDPEQQPCRMDLGLQALYGGSTVCALQLNSVNNMNLRSERSRSGGIGLVLAPAKGLGITLDAYQLDRRNEFGIIPFDYVRNHPEAFPGVLVRDDHDKLYAFAQQIVNLSQSRMRTVDLDASYQWQTLHHGKFSFNLGVNWLVQLKRRLRTDDSWSSLAGKASQPHITALGAITWQRQPWSLGATIRHTGHYASATNFMGEATFCDSFRRCTTPSFTLVDLNINYTGPTPWTLGVNVQNLFDHEPRFYGYTARTYSPVFDDVIGRYIQLNAQYRY